MPKEFNTTGTCIPEKHYMADVHTKIDAIEKMVDKGNYFVIARPRQYGKTTTMYLLKQRLEKRYSVIKTSFEGFGDEVFENADHFGNTLFINIKDALMRTKRETLAETITKRAYNSMTDVGMHIRDFVRAAGERVIWMIDEVDKSSNNQLFLNFLGMLRDRYLQQGEGESVTFHSVILAGVHDIKNLKLKLRPDAERKLNSPWNIAVDFTIDMSLHANEIEPMLSEYARDYGLELDTKALSERLYYYTNGYPFLVSKLCKIIDEDMCGEQKRAWDEQDIEHAVNVILKEQNTLFDDLIKNLENNEELYRVVQEIVVDGEEVGFNIDNPVVNTGMMFGIFRENEGKVTIHNRIFEQRIYNYISSKIETSSRRVGYRFGGTFIRENGTLDMEKVLKKFQAFMKEQRSKRDAEFLEREGRLLFLAFIKPIINGNGYDFKEIQISEERRLDVLITFNNQRYVVELKIWRGLGAHKKGLKQLAAYLEGVGVTKGYLLIYDFGKKKQYTQTRSTIVGKRIFAVRV